MSGRGRGSQIPGKGGGLLLKSEPGATDLASCLADRRRWEGRSWRLPHCRPRHLARRAGWTDCRMPPAPSLQICSTLAGCTTTRTGRRLSNTAAVYALRPVDAMESLHNEYAPDWEQSDDRVRRNRRAACCSLGEWSFACITSDAYCVRTSAAHCTEFAVCQLRRTSCTVQTRIAILLLSDVSFLREPVTEHPSHSVRPASVHRCAALLGGVTLRACQSRRRRAARSA